MLAALPCVQIETCGVQELKSLIGGKYTLSEHLHPEAAVEEPVATHAVGYALAFVVCDVGDAGAHARDSRGEDDGTGGCLARFGGYPESTVVAVVKPENAVVAQDGTETFRLPAASFNEFAARDGLVEPEVVVDIVIARHLGGGTEHKGGYSRAGGVDGCRKPCGPGTYDDEGACFHGSSCCRMWPHTSDMVASLRRLARDEVSLHTGRVTAVGGVRACRIVSNLVRSRLITPGNVGPGTAQQAKGPT